MNAQPANRGISTPLLAMCRAVGLGLAASFSLAAAEPDFRQVPGVVVNHRPAASRTYLGSPSIVVATNGAYLVSHDYFGPAASGDRVAVFESVDRGQHWRPLTEIQGGFWSSLFVHHGALYLMGTSRQDGDCVIRRSLDGGRTWTEPRDGQTGRLLTDARYHCAPVPLVVHQGRVWRAMEDVMGPGGWGSYFRALVLSAPVESDLLVATNWIASNRLGRDPTWLDGKFGGWLEGNVVPAPDGSLVNLLRADYRALPEKAALQRLSPDGRTLSFDPAAGFVDFPGGCKKFTVRRDPQTGRYWSLANYALPRYAKANLERTRNTLALTSSPDLRTWTVNCLLLHHPDTVRCAFQYADWQFDENDLIAAVRTAYEDGLGGAHNCHDANFITFHRVRRFRELTMADSVPIPTPAD